MKAAQFIVVSLGLHVIGAVFLAATSRPTSTSEPKPLELDIIAGGGEAVTSSTLPDEISGGAKVPARVVHRYVASKLTEADDVASEPVVDAGTITVEPESSDTGVLAVEEVPLGGGAGDTGVGALALGESTALIQRRIQEVADLMSDGRRMRMEIVVISVDGRGYVENHSHKGDLDKILHLAEPFPAGGPYTVTVEY